MATDNCIDPCITLDNSTLTEGTVSGNGTFDVLMRAAREHLKIEYESGRITGELFSQVYLGAMQTVMQTATQYALSKDMVGYQVSSISQQTMLTAEQRNLIIAQTSLANAQEVKLEGIDTEIAEETLSIMKKTQNFQPMR